MTSHGADLLDDGLLDVSLLDGYNKRRMDNKINVQISESKN